MKEKLKYLIEKIKTSVRGDSRILSVSISMLRFGIKIIKIYFGSFKTTTKMISLSIAAISLIIIVLLLYRTDVEIMGITPISKIPYIITSLVIFLIGGFNIYLLVNKTKANNVIMAMTTYLNVKLCYGTFFALKNWNINLTELYNCKGIIVVNKYYKIGEKIDYIKKLMRDIDDKIDLNVDYLMPDLTFKKMEDLQVVANHIVNLLKKEQKMLELIDLIIKEQEALVTQEVNTTNYKAWIIGGIIVVLLIGICIVVIKKHNIIENTGDNIKETIQEDVIAETTKSDAVINAVETTTTVLKKKKMYTTMITDPKPEIEGNNGYSPSDFVVVEANGDAIFLTKIKNLMLGNTNNNNEPQLALKDEFNTETGVVSTIMTKTPQNHIEHWNNIGINPWRYFEKTRIFKFWQTPEVQEVKKVVKNTIEEV